MTMTTKELLALVGRWRESAAGSKRYAVTEYESGCGHAESRCADELAPIATALCAEVEALTEKLAESRAIGERHVQRRCQLDDEIEALRKDAERWRVYVRELPASGKTVRRFIDQVIDREATERLAKEPK